MQSYPAAEFVMGPGICRIEVAKSSNLVPQGLRLSGPFLPKGLVQGRGRLLIVLRDQRAIPDQQLLELFGAGYIQIRQLVRVSRCVIGPDLPDRSQGMRFLVAFIAVFK